MVLPYISNRIAARHRAFRRAVKPHTRRWCIRVSLLATIALLGMFAEPLAGPALAQSTQPSDEPSNADTTASDTTASDTMIADTSGIRMRVQMPELRVEAVRPPADLEAAASTIRIGADAIRETGAASVGSVLAERTPAFLQRYGATGSSTLSLRGTQGNQSQVLLDGLRVADPQTGQVDLSLIPSVMIESIEVVQGATSARYGSGSLGGTVRLRTLRAQDSLLVRTAAEAGAFGERSTSAVTTGSVGSWRALVSGRLATEDGDFSYTNEALVPAQTVRRQGAGLTTRTVYARVGAPSSGRLPGDWSLSGWHTAADRGLPGPANAPAGGATQDNRISRLWLTGDLSVGTALVKVSGQYTHGTSRYRNPATSNRTETVSQSAELSATGSWALPQSSGGGLGSWLHDGWVDVGVTGRLDAASVNADARQWTTGAFAEAELGTSWLRLFPAARLDILSLQNAEISAPSFPLPDRSDPSGATVTVNPRLGAELRPFKEADLRLTGRVSRAFRAPTFTERFYQPGGTPGLDNESGWSTEVGLRLQRSRPTSLAVFQANAFRTIIRDQIVWAPSFVDSGVQVWSPSNIDAVHTRGVEVSGVGEIRLTGDVSLGGGALFTVTQAENRANPNAASFGAQLPYVPRQQVKVWLNAEVHRFAAGIAAQAVSERFYSSDETQSTPPYQGARAHASYTQPLGDASLTFRVDLDNAFDQNYEIVRLYPMPPRHLSARLILNLSP